MHQHHHRIIETERLDMCTLLSLIIIMMMTTIYMGVKFSEQKRVYCCLLSTAMIHCGNVSPGNITRSMSEN